MICHDSKSDITHASSGAFRVRIGPSVGSCRYGRGPDALFRSPLLGSRPIRRHKEVISPLTARLRSITTQMRFDRRLAHILAPHVLSSSAF
jgi:hypothetical protein